VCTNDEIFISTDHYISVYDRNDPTQLLRTMKDPSIVREEDQVAMGHISIHHNQLIICQRHRVLIWTLDGQHIRIITHCGNGSGDGGGNINSATSSSSSSSNANNTDDNDDNNYNNACDPDDDDDDTPTKSTAALTNPSHRRRLMVPSCTLVCEGRQLIIVDRFDVHFYC
jgi:hypothetical protein